MGISFMIFWVHYGNNKCQAKDERGVKAFSFCKRRNLLLTGGMGRIIRVWNPYLPGKPTGMLKSHMAPVVYIHVSAEDNKIFSMSTDNTIKAQTRVFPALPS
ncbi:WD repeat-containing protein 49-like [Canis lupus familiaris]|uniref:WD repeat-containing protein 49-like n=1 Tax=Canis lupus familiaris TaxID=9615 RepID=UPI000DC6A405|nr:WD repeat-containing protein 49-like [Canis lupus familiaris]XP_038314269.1 WD repeat-containing protein 49-like [Canis lupus familiaris]XP_038429269.1 WD repeat-containing protein 49-like [Canis lupus familiaris]